MNKVIIVGGGAAGMLCSIIAARNGCEVFLYEKNEKLGKKLYITGKGRCNVTNNCEVEDLLRAVMTNSKFLYSAFYTFNSQDMMALLEEAGVPLKTERGNRVFPQSDRSSECRCSSRCDRRPVLSDDRFHRRRISFCTGDRASGDRLYPISCSA